MNVPPIEEWFRRCGPTANEANPFEVLVESTTGKVGWVKVLPSPATFDCPWFYGGNLLRLLTSEQCQLKLPDFYCGIVQTGSTSLWYSETSEVYQELKLVKGSHKYPYQGGYFCVRVNYTATGAELVPGEDGEITQASSDKSEVNNKKRKADTAVPDHLLPAKRAKVSSVVDGLDESAKEVSDFVFANIGVSRDKLELIIKEKTDICDQWEHKLRKFKAQVDALRCLREALYKCRPIAKEPSSKPSPVDLQNNTAQAKSQSRYVLKGYPK